MSFPFPIIPPLGPAARAEVDEMTSGANNVVYTFTDRNAGAPDPDRYLVAAVTMSDDGTAADATACTIGGVTATEVVSQTVTNLSESNYAGLWIAKVPTGETATVVVTGNTTMQDCGVTLYRATGITSPTPTDTDTDGIASGATLTMELDVQSRGMAIAAASSRGGTVPASWSGLTEDSDFQSDNSRHTTASAEFASTQAALAIVATVDSTIRACSVCAHWASA